MKCSALLLSLACFLTANPLLAQLELPEVFGDHMVLQRGQPVRIWGKAEPEARVKVAFGKATARAKADESGRWMAVLDPVAASAKGKTLHVTSGGQSIRIRDVLVGEVWMCSGQSNMEKPIGEKKGQRPTLNHAEELRNADYPAIRLYQVPHYGEVKQPDWEKRWLICSPSSLEQSAFSAVGYFFARKLHLDTGVPVGVIQATYGGTMVETWMPEAAFRADPVLEPLLHRRYFAWVEGVQATDLFHSMVEDLIPYSLNGFLWYQGEANAMYAEAGIYTRKMRALIESWRDLWHAPTAPFLFVQLAPFNYSEWDKFPRQLTPEALPLFREAQTAVLAIPNTGMAVTTDLGGDATDIHPVRKREVGERLALLARAYLPEGLPPRRSPLFSHALIEGNEIVLNFRYSDGGLQYPPGTLFTGFQVAGPDRVFHAADVQLEGSRVRVFTPEVSQPVAVRFAWHEKAGAGLFDASGLPVTPFRTDNWPVKNE